MGAMSAYSVSPITNWLCVVSNRCVAGLRNRVRAAAAASRACVRALASLCLACRLIAACRACSQHARRGAGLDDDGDLVRARRPLARAVRAHLDLPHRACALLRLATPCTQLLLRNEQVLRAHDAPFTMLLTLACIGNYISTSFFAFDPTPSLCAVSLCWSLPLF